MGGFLAVAACVAAYAVEPSSQDKAFMKDAARSALLQLQVAEVAVRRSARPDTKMLAKQLTADYQRVVKGLGELGKKKAIEVQRKLSPEDAAAVKRLEEVPGDSLERAVIDGIASQYEKDLHRYQVESQDGFDSDIRKFATIQRGVLNGHGTMIDTIRERLEKGN